MAVIRQAEAEAKNTVRSPNMSAVRAESCVSARGGLLEAAMNNHLKLGCQIKMSEREPGAFLHAVAELYGPGEAMISAQDWLDELELLDYIPEATPREWHYLRSQQETGFQSGSASKLAERRVFHRPRRLKLSVACMANCAQKRYVGVRLDAI
jgi:hypothetical protein